MKLSRDQPRAHRPPASFTGSRHDGHNGGSPTTRRRRTAARAIPSAAGRRDVTVVVSIASGYCRSGWSSIGARAPPAEHAMSAQRVFDRSLLRARQRRAAALGAATFLVDHVAADLGDRLSVVMREFPIAVDLGTPTAAVRHALAGRKAIVTLIRAAPHLDPNDAGLQVAADEEALPFADASLDLVVSALALQFVNDLPGTLVQVRRALKPDGLFLAALLGGDTLTELRQSF